MIIGHGDIASVIIDRSDKLYFASGVSNSGETRESEFQREVDLLLAQDRDSHLVYFSSLSLFYAAPPCTPYVLHKHFMESLVKAEYPFHTIVRIGNIAWGKNPTTLINFIQNKIRHREPFEIRDEYRYILEKEDLLHWMELIPPWPCEMNLTGRKMKVIDVVKEYCYPWRNSDGPYESYHPEQELQVR